MSLGSSRRYLVRALYDWIVDGDEEPYIIVDCLFPHVRVPERHIRDNQIILNIAPRAITQVEFLDFELTFQTRFAGVPTSIVLPYGAISAIYGRESGLGMAFGQEPGGIPEYPEFKDKSLPQPVECKPHSIKKPPSPRKGKPDLRIVRPED